MKRTSAPAAAHRFAIARPIPLDPPVTTTGVAPLPDRLLIDVDSDPPFSWRAENGAEGESVAVRVDLTDAIAYVVVAPDTAFRLRDEDAAAIRDALFIRR